jgi:uncharacterized membrane protein
MRKTVLTWGLISGALSVAMLVVSLPLTDRLGFEKAEIFGYTTLVVAGLLVFFGVRSYRDTAGGGRLSFGRGFAVGLLITLVSCLCYVAAWQVIYFKLRPDFLQKYTEHSLEKARATGATEERLAQMRREAEEFQRLYDNPAFNAAVTLLEPFPIGLLAALVSAGVLRRK